MANRLRAAWSPGLLDSCAKPSVGGLAVAASSTKAATKAASLAGCSSGDETQLPSSPGAYASSSSPLRRGRHSWYGSPLVADSGKVASPSSAQDSVDSLAETSRHVLREVNTQARFEALYRDGESRRKRREATEREKIHKEEEEFKMMQTKHQPSRRRAWEPRWANEQALTYVMKQQALEDRRLREAASKENAALKECSFAPRLVAGDGSRRRKMAKARRILEELAEEQKIWTHRVEALRVELAPHYVARSDNASNERCSHDQDSDSADDYEASLEDREEIRVVAERRYRLGMLQVLDNLVRLQTQALATVSRALGQSSIRDPLGEAFVETIAHLKDMCPSFDVDVLPRLRSDVSRFDVPADPGKAWEVPGALLRAPIPVQLPSEVVAPSQDARQDNDSGQQRDEARPWTWN